VNDFNTQDEPDRESVPPLVSILIPVHNRLDLTRACVASIFDTASASVPFEILVIDDGSTDGTAGYLDTLGPNVAVIQNETRKSFAEKINLAASVARGEFLCLLNNDTLVTSGWLEKLLAAVRNDPGIAVVGNLHLTPETGLINHAGMVFNAQGFPVHLYRGQPADFRPALVSQEFQTVTAACWLVAKRIFLDLGGFDPVFKNSFEDVDFCLRARQGGYKIFYAADSVIYHHGLSTPGRTDHEQANAEYFQSKWGGSIVPDLDKYYAVLETSSPREASDIEERYSHVEKLSARHPLIASLLRAVIRLATSMAKRLN